MVSIETIKFWKNQYVSDQICEAKYIKHLIAQKLGKGVKTEYSKPNSLCEW